jgi:hypothetical protein
VGYILAQVPSNLVANKIKWPGVYICAGMAGWGVISALVSIVHDFSSLLVIRVLLGVLEAVVSNKNYITLAREPSLDAKHMLTSRF